VNRSCSSSMSWLSGVEDLWFLEFLSLLCELYVCVIMSEPWPVDLLN
jgi:hypothetical protein